MEDKYPLNTREQREQMSSYGSAVLNFFMSLSLMPAEAAYIFNRYQDIDLIAQHVLSGNRIAAHALINDLKTRYLMTADPRSLMRSDRDMRKIPLLRGHYINIPSGDRRFIPEGLGVADIDAARLDDREYITLLMLPQSERRTFISQRIV